MQVQSLRSLLNWILHEYETQQSIFGIHRSLFYTPKQDSPLAIDNLFGHYLATPIGPAAGPHTQLAQNIVCAWLSGGRFIELKTVQIMDELEIPRPCIDMADEGYNVEWSQELRLEQSVHEYVNAWALIHVLRRLLGFEGQTPFGVVFNMSVGYDLEGIQSQPMTRFMDKLADASQEIAIVKEILQADHPQFADIEIPTQLTNNVMLSTMHGCPPDEIERIAKYLLVERGLHTTVKLNPTLLGKERVLDILHNALGYCEIHIPDSVFEHDLRYERAVELIRTLEGVAAGQGLSFGVKLSNTLAMANHRRLLPGDEMYMSGRALYPITINLFHKLAKEFEGDIRVSYSAGADALNVSDILAAGAWPVTVASDLLKPGGYSRLVQYLENLETHMRQSDARSLDELAQDKLTNLERAAAEALQDPRYKKSYHPFGLPKLESGLSFFDCIAAPCVAQCAVCQDVPEYVWLVAQGQYDRALEVILARNPLPGVTGHVCTHLCQTRCTRNNYDQPVAIRALKRFAADRGRVSLPAVSQGERKVAVIGSGPSGLAAAYFLALNGIGVTIYEAQDRPGGMLAIAPAFRLPTTVVQADIERIEALGVEIKLNHPINEPPESLLQAGFDAVYVACGFPQDARLNIEGLDGQGVHTALDFLGRVARGQGPDLGDKVLVIGGGNTAMDAARTAQRLTGRATTIVYRRSQAEMPAEAEELAWFFEEGNALLELASPQQVVLQDGRLVGLTCLRNQLGQADADGRRRPLPVAGSQFQIEASAIILAIGQQADVAFLDGSAVTLRQDGAIRVDPETGGAGIECVYAGGDAVRGPAIIIEACADGRRAAEAICRKFGLDFSSLRVDRPLLSDDEIQKIKRARAFKQVQQPAAELPLAQRDGFALVEQGLSEQAARKEAARCVQCASFCEKCVEVCPNRANYVYHTTPLHLMLPQLACQEGRLALVGETPFAVEQSRQIIHIDDFCNQCGNCATFCVHQGQPFLDKPRLFLREGDFAQEKDNAFFIAKRGAVWAIRRRDAGKEACLFIEAQALTFENELLSLVVSLPDFQIVEMTLKKAFPGLFSLVGLAEMYIILKGVVEHLPFVVQA